MPAGRGRRSERRPPTLTPHPAGPSGVGTSSGAPGARLPDDMPAPAGDMLRLGLWHPGRPVRRGRESGGPDISYMATLSPAQICPHRAGLFSPQWDWTTACLTSWSGAFLGSPVIKTLSPMQGAWVRSLVGKLRSHTPHNSESVVAQLCPTLCDPMDCSPPGSSVHGILQARIMEWVAIPFSRDPPDQGIEPRSPAL